MRSLYHLCVQVRLYWALEAVESGKRCPQMFCERIAGSWTGVGRGTFSVGWHFCVCIEVGSWLLVHPATQFHQLCLSSAASLNVKGKGCHLYSASREMFHFWSAQHGSHSFLHCKYTMPPLPRSSPDGATTEWTVIAPADEAYYSFIDPVSMKGWVGLVGWPTADDLPI